MGRTSVCWSRDKRNPARHHQRAGKLNVSACLVASNTAAELSSRSLTLTLHRCLCVYCTVRWWPYQERGCITGATSKQSSETWIQNYFGRSQLSQELLFCLYLTSMMMVLDDERWKLSSDNYNVVVCFVGSGTFTYLLFFFYYNMFYLQECVYRYICTVYCLFGCKCRCVFLLSYFYYFHFLACEWALNHLSHVAYIVPDSNMSSNAQKHFSP